MYFPRTHMASGVLAVVAIGLSPVFATAQDNNDQGEAINVAENTDHCKSPDIIRYDLEKDGLTLQSAGRITNTDDGKSEIEGHRFEYYANQDTGRWAFIELRGEELACTMELGRVFAHEADRPEDGTKTLRQSVTAHHGSGDSGNAAFQIFAHEGTGRWIATRSISEDKIDIIFGGDGYIEENRLPLPPLVHL